MTIETKQDVYDLPNGAVISFRGDTLLKVRTKKRSDGTIEGLGVVDLDSETHGELRSVNDGFVLTDRNPVAFGGTPHDPSEVSHERTDKELLKTYISRINNGSV